MTTAQRREYQGGAVDSYLSAGIGSGDATASLGVVTGWPTGSIGPFTIVVDPDQSNEEKMLVTSRSGTTLSTITRGFDGSTAHAHGINAPVKHVIGASDLSIVNQHAADPTQDDHTQYVHTSIPRTIDADHDFTGDPVFNGTPSFTGAPSFTGNPTFLGTPQFTNMGGLTDISTVDLGARAAGTSPKPAKADHKHNLDIAAVVNAVVPAGVLVPTASAAVPSGWLVCNGQAISRSTYPALFIAIGTGYGPGDGTTTFNVPDLRDRFICGGGSTRAGGGTGGADTATLSTSHMPSHTHGINDPGHGHSVSDPGHRHGVDGGDTGFRIGVSHTSSYGFTSSSIAQAMTLTNMDTATTGVSVNSNTTGVTTQSAGSGSPVTIVPKYFAAANVLIKAH